MYSTDNLYVNSNTIGLMNMMNVMSGAMQSQATNINTIINNQKRDSKYLKELKTLQESQNEKIQSIHDNLISLKEFLFNIPKNKNNEKNSDIKNNENNDIENNENNDNNENYDNNENNENIENIENIENNEIIKSDKAGTGNEEFSL